MTERNMNRIKKLQVAGQVKLNNFSINAILNTYKKSDLCEKAQLYYKNGELDQAYTTIYKFLLIVAFLCTKKDSIDWAVYGRRIGKDYKTAVELTEKWQEEIQSLSNENDNLNSELSEHPMMENLIPDNKMNTPHNCAWLHSLLVEFAAKLLIIDTRPRTDYKQSHIKFEGINIVNIPEDVLKEGISAGSVCNEVTASESDIYNKRNEYSCIVLLHMKPDAKASEILYTALSKFDKHRHRCLVILAEGYIDWCDFYPHLVEGNAPKEDNIKPYEDINLNNVKYDFNLSFDNDYTDTQEYFKSPAKTSVIPRFDRSKKPVQNRDNTKRSSPTENEDNTPKTEDYKQIELFKFKSQKDSEIEAERNRIIEEEAERKLKDLEVERKNSEKRLSFEKKEIAAHDDLERRRGLKNHSNEFEINNEIFENGQSRLNSHADSDRKRNSQSALNHFLYQTDLPKFDRGSKPRQARISNPVIGVSPGLTGLKNLGNTCYMNSILQCISNNSTLARYFYESCFYNDINRKQQYRGEIAEKVADVVRALWAGNHRAVACQPLKSAIGFIKPEYKTCEQQDSHEFLTYLMDWLHCDLKKDVPYMIENDAKSEMEKVWRDFKIKNESVIFALFYGLQRSTVECLKCLEQSSTYEPFSNLSLIIPEENNVSLSDCLNLYLKGELISGWRCPKCNIERPAKKTVDLCILPNILVIHLKRFSFLDISSKKRTTFVDFPLENLSLENNNGQLRSYDLFGVSNHYGTIEGGHYTAYCKNPQYNRWYKFDDHEVLDLSPSNVTTSAAYILFYSSPDKKQFHS